MELKQEFQPSREQMQTVDRKKSMIMKGKASSYMKPFSTTH